MKRLKLNRWLITIVALTMLFLVFQLDEEIQPELQQSEVPDSDYFMQNVTVYQFDEKGNISNTLKANKMQHYIKDDISILTTPEITYNKNNYGVWKLGSPRGKLRSSNHLTLEGLVTIEEFSNTVEAKSKIHTKNLNVDLEENLASTSEHVLITNPFFKTESTGFEFDFSSESIRLLADVKTEIYQK